MKSSVCIISACLVGVFSGAVPMGHAEMLNNGLTLPGVLIAMEDGSVYNFVTGSADDAEPAAVAPAPVKPKVKPVAKKTKKAKPVAKAKPAPAAVKSKSQPVYNFVTEEDETPAPKAIAPAPKPKVVKKVNKPKQIAPAPKPVDNSPASVNFVTQGQDKPEPVEPVIKPKPKKKKVKKVYREEVVVKKEKVITNYETDYAKTYQTPPNSSPSVHIIEAVNSPIGVQEDIKNAEKLYTSGRIPEAKKLIDPIATRYPRMHRAQILKRFIDQKMKTWQDVRETGTHPAIYGAPHEAHTQNKINGPQLSVSVKGNISDTNVNGLPTKIAALVVNEIHFRDASVADIVRALGKSTQQNIVVASDFNKKISLDLVKIKLEDALAVLCRIAKADYSYENGVILIESRDDALTTKVYTMKYASAAEQQAVLQRLLSSKGTIDVDSQVNRVIVRDARHVHKQVKNLLVKLDTHVPQIMIDSKLVSISRGNLKNLGVKWGKFSEGETFPTQNVITNGFDFIDGAVTNETGAGIVNLAGPSGSLSGGQIIVGATGKYWDGTVQLDALLRKSDAKLLASPRVATTNGKQARIVIGEKVPYKEKTQTTTGTTETTKFVDVGITLNVTPRVSSENFIQLNIHTEDSKLIELIDNQPRIETSEADAIVSVANKGLVVIGGLLQEEKQTTRDKVPVLGDIPLVGFLFSAKSHDITKKELVIMVQPTIMDPEETQYFIDTTDYMMQREPDR